MNQPMVYRQGVIDKIEQAFLDGKLKATYGARTIKISYEDQESIHLYKVSWQIFIKDGALSMDHMSVNGRLVPISYNHGLRLEAIGNQVAVMQRLQS